jgi:flagellar hook assembly protein FlgD
VNATAEDQTGLAAGNYSVIVTDANGCATAPLPVTITQPATNVTVAITSQTNVLCRGASTGAINITASGGTGAYTYAWTGTGVNATAEDQTGLAAGNYSVIVTDANGCATAPLPVTITQPATNVTVAITSQTNVLCRGASTGAINITASGGTGAYTYAWTGTGVNATAEDQTGLAAGNYSVIVTDANGCATAPLPVTITQPATNVTVAITSQTNVLCRGASTGAIDITPSGGTGAYTYAWTGTGVNPTAQDQTGLAAGNYSVIVTDANGCATAPLPVAITQPATNVTVALTSQTNVLCRGASTGAIDITPSGGTGAYTYAWTGTGVNPTAQDQTGLAAGNYSVIVTDANGCATAPLP